MSSSNSEKLFRKDLILSYTKDLSKDFSKNEIVELSVNLDGSVVSISPKTVFLIKKHLEKVIALNDIVFDFIPFNYLEGFLQCFRKAALGRSSYITIPSAKLNNALDFQFRWSPDTSDLINISIFEIDNLSSEDILKEEMKVPKLRDNIKIFQSLFENHPDAIYSFNKEGVFTNANNSALLLGEITKENVVLRNVMEVIPVEDVDRIRAHFKQALGGVTQNYNTNFISFKGTRRIINVTNFPIISNEKIIGVFGIAKDITEIEISRNHATLLESRYKTILDQSLDVICTMDANGCFVDVNEACYTIWGYTPEELRGVQYLNLVHQEDLEKTSAASKEIHMGNNKNDFSNRYIRKDGSIVPMLWSSKWVEEEQLFYSIAKNASESYAIKLKLEEERNILRAIIDNIPDYIFAVNENNESILANKKFYSDFMGKQSEDNILGLTPPEYFPNNEGLAIIKDNQLVMNSGEPVINRHDVVYDYQGKREVILLTKMPLKSSNNEVFGLVGVGRNVTDKYKLEEEQKLIYNLIEALGSASNIESALYIIIQRISEFFNFEYAVAFDDRDAIQTLSEIARFKNDSSTKPSEDINMRLLEVSQSAKNIKEIVIVEEDQIFIGMPIIFDKKVIQILSFSGPVRGEFSKATKEFLYHLGIQIAGELQRKITETQLNHLFKHSPTLIAVIGLDGYLKKVSPSFTKTFGYSEEELLSTPYYKFLHPDEVHVSFERLKEVSQGYMPRSYEGRCRSKDGTWKWISWTPSEIMSDDGMINLFGLDITPLKTGNLELLKYKNIIESSTEGILLVTLENQEVYLNSSLRNTLGFSQDETILIDNIKSIFKNKKIGDQIFNKLLAGEYWNTEIEIINRDGEIFEFNFSGGPVFNHNHELIAVYGIHSDITERKNHEKELKIYNDKVNNILESITDGFFSINEDWKVTYFNQEAEKLLRISKKDIINKYLWDYYPQFENSLSHKKYTEVFKTGKKVTFEDYFKSFDMWFEVNVYPAVSGISVYFKDITVKKKVDEEIKNAKERYDLITKVTHEAIYDWDLLTNSLEWSDAYYSSFGYKIPNKESGLAHWENQLYPEDKETVTENLEKALAAKEVKFWEFEYRLVKANKEVSNVIDRGIITRDNEGHAIRMIGSLQDITEIKKNERILEELNSKLKLHANELAISNAELEQFAYIASHDLQEPLRMVTSFLTQLNKKYKDQLDPKAQQYIYFATDGAIRMRQILLDLLEYSRVGRMDYHLEKIDLNILLTDIIKLHSGLISDLNGKVLFNDLPSIYAAPSPIQRVISNLITNALKYQKKGNIPVINITVEEDKEYWQINVQDNGIGIAKQFFEKIFVVFQRLHSKDEYSGTGIGLAICRKIIENHGGKIWLTSKLNEGSTFHFTIKKQI